MSPVVAVVELARETVDRDDDRAVVGGEIGQNCMIGAITAIEAPGDIVRVRVPIGWDDRPVIEAHDQGWIILAPVRINHEPREIGARSPGRRDGSPGPELRPMRRCHRQL